MAKFSGKAVRANLTAPVRTIGRRTLTFEVGLGFERDARSELFVLAVANMVGEDTFYECARRRDERFVSLVQAVAREDPEWVARFIPWLRGELHLRSAPMVMAAEYVAAGGPEGRKVVASALRRADEPAEMLAYWVQTHGRAVPQPVKRGVADAVARLYDERAAVRYDGLGRAWRMGDVLELVHPRPRAAWQSDLFRYLLDRRHRGAEARAPESLPTLAAVASLERVPGERRRAVPREQLEAAAMSWERLSGWLGGPMDAAAWESVIPSMGYMSLVRNLRNFDQAGVSDAVSAKVAARIADHGEVRRSRQMPMRFWSAWTVAPSMRWADALERALQHSLENVPSLRGRTLVLVDVSGSMDQGLSRHTGVRLWQIAALFGAALAARAEAADVYAFSNGLRRIEIGPVVPLLRTVARFADWPGSRGGTETLRALASTLDFAHDRVVVLTDEQAFPGGRRDVRIVDGIAAPIYTFNLAGYRAAHLASGERGRYTFAGLNDAAFVMLNVLEDQRKAGWPF